MSAATISLHGVWRQRGYRFPRLEVQPDAECVTVSIDADGDAVSLRPWDARRLAFTLLELAREKDGKDWVEELDRVKVTGR